ncbi:MAG: Calx-beta domain-containing protein, partial [Limisphaerales bacterium]
MTGSGAFEFSSANYQAAENGIVAAITIRRTGGASGTNADGSGDVFVNFSTSNGTAKAGTNYETVITNVDFPPGEVLKTVLVPVLDDFVITPDLTVNLALSNSLAGVGDQSTATLTILNVDSAVSFASTYYSQVKNALNGFAAIDIARQGSTNGACSMDFYTTTNGTAIAGTDYYPTNATIVFNPGQSVAQALVPIINNGLVEGNRTVTLLLTNPVNTLLYSPSNATLTIIDTVAAPGQLSFAGTNYVVNEGDGNAVLTLTRTNGSSGSVSVTWTPVPGTAQPNLNYVATGGTVTFGNGETTKTITIPLVDNNVVQGPVSLSVVLSNPTGGSTLTAPISATLTILDNDTGFAFLNATNFVTETNGLVPIFVQRIGGTNGGVQVNYSTTNGTALAGVNYRTISGTLSFSAGEMLKAISLPLIYDPQVTGNLDFTMKLSNPTAGTVLVGPSNAVVVVQDADAGLSFTNSTMNVFKNDNNAVITVVCSNPAVEPVVVDTNVIPLSVHYSTSDGTAMAGVDYTAVNGTLIFTNGIGTNTFNVPIINNSLVQGDKNFVVQLSNPTAPGQLVAPSNQVVTIIDDNSGLNFSSPVYTVLKTGVAATITVQRSDNTNIVSAVHFTTSDGTAIAGVDYIPTNGLIVFTNGEISKTFTVTVIANTTVEPDKTVLLQLSNPTNGFLIAPYAATLTIHDTSGSLVVPAGSTFAPNGDPNHNGIIDPGENVSLLFAFRASGGTNVPDLSATLLATNGITSPSPGGPVSYGTLVVNGPSASRQFSFTANGTNSQRIVATFKLQSGANSLGTNGFTYTLGTWTMTFTNTNAIIINDDTIASPYPSTLDVSNVGGTIINATITLTNLSHTSPGDIDALLVSPAQQDTLIMSHAGAQNAVKNVTLTFDDAATNSLPQNGALTSGTNRPTQYPPAPQ